MNITPKNSVFSENKPGNKPLIRNYAFKGFSKNLCCRKFQYNVGETYVHDGKISLCSAGFHYCYRMSDVFNYYPNNDIHVFAIVEPSGDILTGSDKAVSSKLKIVRLLTKEEVERFIKLEENEKYEKDVFYLDIVKKLQEKYLFSIGGSCALFLQGITLNRDKSSIDLDIIMPYYQKISIEDFTDDFFDGIEEFDDDFFDGIGEFDGKGSGNDYDYTFAITTKDGRFVKLDIKINPEQKYSTVNFKSFTYKVCDLFTILEAKIRYAIAGNEKHKEDVMSMFQHDTTPMTETKSTEQYFSELLKDVVSTAPVINSIKNERGWPF